MLSTEKNLVVRLSVESHKNYKGYCLKEGKTVSQMTRELIKSLLEGRLKIKNNSEMYREN